VINKKNIQRRGNRQLHEIRPVSFVYNPFGFAPSSVLYRAGDTVVVASVSLNPGVPQFLRGKGEGWLTAEYEMLPISTRKRNVRESTLAQRNARSVEISRLIGRVFRSVFDPSKLGEFTVYIDCDVLQADGGTRTAAIAAVSLALSRACDIWHKNGIIPTDLTVQKVAAISVGIKDSEVYLDLDQDEDNSVDADFNFVMTESGEIIEIQGTCEKKPVSADLFNQLYALGQQGVEKVFEAWNFGLAENDASKAALFNLALPSKSDEVLKPAFSTKDKNDKNLKTPLFSLGNRIAKK